MATKFFQDVMHTGIPAVIQQAKAKTDSKFGATADTGDGADKDADEQAFWEQAKAQGFEFPTKAHPMASRWNRKLSKDDALKADYNA